MRSPRENLWASSTSAAASLPFHPTSTPLIRLTHPPPASFPCSHPPVFRIAFICTLAPPPRKAAALSSSVYGTVSRHTPGAARCACHSSASAYDDYDMLAARLSAALRPISGCGRVGPVLLLCLSSLPISIPCSPCSMFSHLPLPSPRRHLCRHSFLPSPPSLLISLVVKPSRNRLRSHTTRVSSRELAPLGLALLARIDERYVRRRSTRSNLASNRILLRSPPSLLPSFDAPRAHAIPIRARPLSPAPSFCSLLPPRPSGSSRAPLSQAQYTLLPDTNPAPSPALRSVDSAYTLPRLLIPTCSLRAKLGRA
ncbi:hypothetical protein DFH08DRAFT_971751 [Mycena albidolilacea]|uniref:Uncharacterized protein n=1 Tax=Mycena albidolilacea TaxID=1033008 RepID=A0AAD6ZD14_9AGAR|nr:hypothetical protein DFH08DRAFT_971751 [Mycena albidolilacea]